MKEIWLPVVGYEGFYSVSNRGRVRRDLDRTSGKAGNILKSTKRDRYSAVMLSMNGKTRNINVHILVARAFLGPCPSGMNINHKDGKRHRNIESNLEYGTQRHNVKEAFRLGLRDCRGIGNGQAKLTNRRVRAIRKSYTGQRGEQTAIARKWGVSSATIRDILAGRTWAHIS